MRQIVVDKSIRMKRMVYKLSALLVFDYVMLYFLVWIFPAISVKLIWFPSRYNTQTPYVNYFVIAFDLWLLLGLYLMNKLVAVKGKSFKQNKEDITNVLQDNYPEIAFTSGNPDVIRGETRVGYLREKIITVILHEEYVYINILHTYRGSSFSFVHGITDYMKCLGIAKSFKFAQL